MNGIHERKTIEKWEWDFNLSNRQAGFVRFEKQKQFAGKWNQDNPPRPPSSGPLFEKQRQQMIKLRNLGGAEKFFLSQDEQICLHWGIFTTSEIIIHKSLRN